MRTHSRLGRTFSGGDEETDQTDNSEPQQRNRAGAAGTDAEPTTKTLSFEYDLASGKLTLLDENAKPLKKPRWASVSPDDKSVIFARGHNLYMMDADNYAKAQKK